MTYPKQEQTLLLEV